jgi:hypothetical protein
MPYPVDFRLSFTATAIAPAAAGDGRAGAEMAPIKRVQDARQRRARISQEEALLPALISGNRLHSIRQSAQLNHHQTAMSGKESSIYCNATTRDHAKS